MNPQHYNDGQADPQDPTDQRSVDFDWEGLESALGESELGPVEYQRLAFALGRVLRWVVLPNGGGVARQGIIARRLIALAWVVDPRMFDGTPSLGAMAKRHRLTLDSFQKQTLAASRKWGVRNAHQYRTKSKPRAKYGNIGAT